MRSKACIGAALLMGCSSASAFLSASPALARRRHVTTVSATCTEESLKTEAELLLAKAKALRAEIEQATTEKSTSLSTKSSVAVVMQHQSPWGLPEDNLSAVAKYRLYMDIGREEGTWMDPRWGSSGRRMEFTLDVCFSSDPANAAFVHSTVKDNMTGKSSKVQSLRSASYARLQKGFDRMKCHGGAWRVDEAKRGPGTARFQVLVDGTPELNSPYGDIVIPRGFLYFSLPVFGQISQLSSKPGPVTVRQMGWHTGWRREGSRIVGTFRAVPLSKARAVDGF